MRAGNCWCRLPAGGVAALAVLALGVNALGVPNVELRPVNNGLYRPAGAPVIGTAVISGNMITLQAGGVNVEMELLASNWGDAPIPPGETETRLGAVQATMDGTSYLGLNASPSQPGVDLNPLGNPATRTDGAWIVQTVCSSNLRDCTTGQPACGGGEGFCIPNPRWVSVACNPLAVLALASINYEYGTVCQSGSVANVPSANAVSNGYFGSIILQVPGAAATTYTVSFVDDANFTFMNNQLALFVPVTEINGVIRVATGSCCQALGGGATLCTPNLTSGACGALPGGSNQPPRWRDGIQCPAPQGNGPDCPSCQSAADCRDPIPGQVGNDNLCTTDVCTNFVCTSTPDYNTVTHCCNPSVGENGGLTPIDDGDPCTDDVCDPVTGQVAHNPTTGNACDDGFACTVDDTCDAGACNGTDVNTIPCADTADCPLGECDTLAGFCACSEDTPLCVEFRDKECSLNGAPCQTDEDCGTAGGLCIGTNGYDANCYDAGETVNAVVAIGAGSECVSGGQVRIEYDTACLTLVSAGVCPGSIYTNVIANTASNGVIFFAATSNVNTPANECSPGPADFACLTFTKTGDCDACDVCLVDLNPQNNILTNDAGNRVPLASCGCSKTVDLAGDVTLNTPAGSAVNADCGQAYGTVSWSTPSASDSCDGPLTVDCQAQHDGGVPVGGLISNGGVFPQGKTFFTCTAENACGKSKTNVWTVMVSDNQTLDVEVHLQPVMNNAGIFNRAITFELYNDCSSEPVEECAVMQFQGPFNFPGHAHATLKVDKGNFLCMTARDNLHTLRSIVDGNDLSCINNRWTAIFKGDPTLGGNWLVGGNLDAKKADATYGDINTINILDFGVFMAELAAGASYEPNGDTTCSTPFPHGDINADGAVDSLDYSFIVANFLKNSKNLCCPGTGAAVLVEANPITEISVKDLRSMGYGMATVADLNNDGKVNRDDMTLFMQGVTPQANPVRNMKSRGTR